MTESAPREDDILAEFDRKRDEALAEKEKLGWSGRVLLYLDVKRGKVVEVGEVYAAAPWARTE